MAVLYNDGMRKEGFVETQQPPLDPPMEILSNQLLKSTLGH